MRIKQQRRFRLRVFGMAAVGLALTLCVGCDSARTSGSTEKMAGSGTAAGSHSARPSYQTANPGQQTQYWTCSMHPNIKTTTPGKCPDCSMNLVPMQ